MLCAEGRLVFQPEPRRAREAIVPLVWDAGRPWEFALIIEPGDDTGLEACLQNDLLSKKEKRVCPKKASLNGLLVRGSERQSLQTPRLILRAGFLVIEDRLCRLVVDAATEEQQGECSEQDEPAGLRGWMEQLMKRSIELSGHRSMGSLSSLLPCGLTQTRTAGMDRMAGRVRRPQPKLVLDDSPSVKDEEHVESVDPEESLGRPKRKSRKSKSKIQLGGAFGLITVACR